jgi:polysaccharide biosynthesis transport protein
MPGPEEQGAAAPDVTYYVRAIMERWWLVVAAVVVVLILMLYPALTGTPMYRASAQLVYQTNNLDKALLGSDVFTNDNEARSISTAAALIKTAPIAEAVRKQLHSQLPTAALLNMVEVESFPTTDILEIRAASDDPEDAASVANAFADQFVAFRENADKQVVATARDKLKAKLDSLSAEDAASAYGLMLKEKYENLEILESMQTGGYAIVQSAEPPASPFSPRPMRNALIGLVGGLILGLGATLVMTRLDRRLKDVKAVEAAFQMPVLASVPQIGRWRHRGDGKRHKKAVGFRAHPQLLESFRVLRSSLQYFDLDQKIKTILVTSSMPREGKTTTVINLGLSLVLAGSRVLIVEADLRHPMVPQYLSVDDKVGVSTLLTGSTTIAEALRSVNADSLLPEGVREKASKNNPSPTPRGLFCLPAGPLPPNPAELLSSTRMTVLLEELGQNRRVDYVLVDAPPVLSVADALVIAQQVDAVVVTCKVNGTTRDQAEEVSEQLRRAGARVIGVVAGGVKQAAAYRRQGYYYGHR